MSKYTTEVRFICENLAGLTNSEGYTSTKEIIANSREKVFDFDYPIFDESYRSVLETKILKHFYTREIGAESFGLWKLWLDTRMNEIMPYFNQMYKSTLLEFNPLYDTNITTTHTKDETGNKTDNGETTGTTKDKITTNEESETTVDESKSGSGDSTTTVNSSGTGSDDKWNYYSDTPQGGINGLQNLNYLTNATHATDSSSGTSAETTANQYQNSENNDSTTNYENDITTNKDSSNKVNTSNDSNFTTNEEYVEHVSGKRFGESYSKMLMDFRNTFVNIDLDVIHALDDLFFNLW